MLLNRVISTIERLEPIFYVVYEEGGEEHTIVIDNYEEFRKTVEKIIKDDNKRLISHETNRNLSEVYIWY